MSVLQPLALIAATSAFAALPLGPALLEARRSRDAAALPIRRDDDNISNFAETFRAYSRVHLDRASQQPAVADCVAVISQKGEFRVFENADGGTVGGVVLCRSDITFGHGMVFNHDVFCAGTLIGGAHNIYRAILGEEDICLAEGSHVLRWLHAAGSVSLGADCILHERASAEFTMYLRPGCTFRRIHAPLIAPVRDELERKPSRHSQPQSDERIGASRFPSRLDGYFYLPAGSHHAGSVIARGKALLGAASCLAGNLKSRRHLQVSEQAEVEGSVVSASSIYLGENCFVRGPVISERSVFVAPGAQVGTPESLTTISAPRIILSPGSIIHGTVWARTAGEVGG